MLPGRGLNSRLEPVPVAPAASAVTTFSSLLLALKTCSSLKDLPGGRRVHAHAVEAGLETNLYVATNLINMYAKCGSLVDAYRVFRSMQVRNVVSWTALMLGYSDSGEDELVLELFARMSCLPNHRTFVVVLKSCANLAKKEEYVDVGGRLVKLTSLERGMAVHARAATCKDIFVSNTLVDMYASCGSMEDALRVFCRMLRHDRVSWNALLLGYAVNGEERLALESLFYMQAEGCVPNGRTFVAALRACTGLAEKEERRELDGQIVKVQSLERAMSVHALAERLGCCSELLLHNMLVDLYAKCGSLSDAQQLFNRMLQKDVITWNSMILGYVENGEAEKAWELFSSMEQHPDARTCVTALKASGNMQATEVAKSVHARICRNGFEESSNVIVNSLLDVYGKCGNLVAAQLVFDGCTAAVDTVTWNSLIAGYSRRGDTDKVFGLFQCMVEAGLQPSNISLIHLLSACAHAGDVNKGKRCFRMMQLQYKMKATVDHYICMVDMLGRVHELDVVLEMVRGMPAEARGSVLLWKAVLSSCEKWRNAELGQLAFESLVQLNVKDPAVYSLMINIQKQLNPAWSSDCSNALPKRLS